MDFFRQQDSARQRTRWMVGMFLLSAILVVAAVDGVVAAILMYAETALDPESEALLLSTSDWITILGVTSMITLVVILLGSLVKIWSLSSGGAAVADMMGAQRVDPSTHDFAERRLLNVVQEMALASGIPVPPVYVMTNEPSINAFAAGYTPEDAIVAVTRGTLDHLTRDELQGVVAHEFSHILNGDMRLNIRMMGLLNGILVIFLIGQIMIRILLSSQPRVRRSDDKNSGGAIILAILLISIALMVIGAVGWFLGHLIRASVSRQREYLADASAVQFTRNPGGIGNALIKIGAIDEAHRRIQTPSADEASNMFIANVSGFLGAGCLADHPPLLQRIARLIPQFDGDFSKVPLTSNGLAESGRESSTMEEASASGTSRKLWELQAQAKRQAFFAAFLASMDSQVQRASTEIFSAKALVFAALLERTDQEIRAQQCQTLRSTIAPELFAEFEKLEPSVSTMSSESLYIAMELAMPTLKQLSRPQYEAFREQIVVLIQADGRLNLREYVLQAKILRQLDIFFGLRSSSVTRFRRWGDVSRAQAALVLSRLAYSSSDSEEAQTQAFQKGCEALGQKLERMPRSECDLQAFDTALNTLEMVAPAMKRAFVEACAACIRADGEVCEAETQLFHAICAVLGVPVPLWTEDGE